MSKTITCIVCPRGCKMTATEENGAIVVTGNTCPRGKEHAITECTAPVRSLTAVVRVSNRADTMVSVKTAAPVPKQALFPIMELLSHTNVEAPVHVGDVVLDGVCGTQILITKEIL